MSQFTLMCQDASYVDLHHDQIIIAVLKLVHVTGAKTPSIFHYD